MFLLRRRRGVNLHRFRARFIFPTHLGKDLEKKGSCRKIWEVVGKSGMFGEIPRIPRNSRKREISNNILEEMNHLLYLHYVLMVKICNINLNNIYRKTPKIYYRYDDDERKLFIYS